MNSLVDRQVIEALYRASQAGVKIDLIVRGICCLRPGVKGLSENITVRSIVDRFLEHSRIFYFENACQPEVFISSADWMPRNFFRRIEVAFPIQSGVLRERVIREVLGVTLGDNVKARFLQPDGKYQLAAPGPGAPRRRSQIEFVALASTEPAQHPGAGGKPRYPRVKLAPSPFQPKAATGYRSDMNLFVLRHGIAVELGAPGIAHDAERSLTPEGRSKLRQIAKAMHGMELAFDVILSSPYLRARQTAELIACSFKKTAKVELCEALAPGGTSAQVIEMLRRLKPVPDNLLLVGHEPNLSQPGLRARGQQRRFVRGFQERRPLQTLRTLTPPST